VVAKELGKPATVTLLVNGTKVAQGRVPKTIPATISIVARQPDSDAWLAGFALAIGAALAMRLVFAGVNAVTVSLWIVVPDAACPWATGRLPPAARALGRQRQRLSRLAQFGPSPVGLLHQSQEPAITPKRGGPVPRR